MCLCFLIWRTSQPAPGDVSAAAFVNSMAALICTVPCVTACAYLDLFVTFGINFNAIYCQTYMLCSNTTFVSVLIKCVISTKLLLIIYHISFTGKWRLRINLETFWLRTQMVKEHQPDNNLNIKMFANWNHAFDSKSRHCRKWRHNVMWNSDRIFSFEP